MSAADFVTARDLLSNSFVIVVHRAILRGFHRAIRQRQVILSQYGVPAEAVALVSALMDAEKNAVEQEPLDFEALAYAFFYFINFKYWEETRSTKHWEVSKLDFEDHLTKSVTCHTSKLPVCTHALIIRAQVGYRVQHTVILCVPSGAVLSLVPTRDAAKPFRRLLHTSDKKFCAPSGDPKGSWELMVDIRRPVALGAFTTFQSRQLDDVAELVVTVKPRHEIEPSVESVLVKCPLVMNGSVPTADEMDLASAAEAQQGSPVGTGNDGDPHSTSLFATPLRFSVPLLLRGSRDPVPLPRLPAQYPLPVDIHEGGTIPPYRRAVLPTPRLVAIASSAGEAAAAGTKESSFDATPVSLKTSQTLSHKVKRPRNADYDEQDEEVEVYTQFIDLTVRIVNRTAETVVFLPPSRVDCRPAVILAAPPQDIVRVDEDRVEATVFSARCAKWDTKDGVLQLASRESITAVVRAEFPVIGRKSGGDYFERSQLDHNEFPQPAVFDVCLQEGHSREEAIVRFWQYNQDRELDTLASMRKRWGAADAEMLAFGMVDDTDNLRRYCAGIFLKADNTLAVAVGGTQHYLDLNRLNALAYSGLMSGRSEIEVSEADGSGTDRQRVVALVAHDQYPPMVFAIRVELTTSTSRTVFHSHVRYHGSDWFTAPRNASVGANSAEESSIGSRTLSSPRDMRQSILSNTSTQQLSRDEFVVAPSMQLRREVRTVSVGTSTVGTSDEDNDERATESTSSAAGGNAAAATTSESDRVSTAEPRASSSENRTTPITSSYGSSTSHLGAAAATLLCGASIGYKIHYDEPLGSGTFGQVYRAFDLQSGQTVAVKETPLSLSTPSLARNSTTTSSGVSQSSAHGSTLSTGSTIFGGESVACDVREFALLTRLDHPNIVKVFSMDIVSQCHALRVFMEWLPSGSIAKLLQRTAFRLHEAVLRAFAKDALKGLAYLHGRGILHLDIKPGNMLVSSDGHVKLADFGTTAILTNGSSTLVTQRIVGTPAYMSPEIISSGKYYRGSDLWAWACCVVEMATGEMPWHHVAADIRSAPVPLMFHIASAKIPNHAPLVPQHLSHELKEILAACFSPTLALRPSASALLECDYFVRETLPLDAELMSEFYRLAHESSEAAAAIAVSNSFSLGSQEPITLTSSDTLQLLSTPSLQAS